MKAPDTGDTTLAVVVLLMFAGALGLVLHQLFTSAAGRALDRD